jgi:hypothetical protein
MKKNLNISPVGLKGNQINERIKELMGMSPINENVSSVVVELTKLGPDNKAYAIIRENHEYYIKVTDKNSNIVAEDFKYIGGLQNKKSEAYPSYAKAIKHLNMKFKSLAEAYNFKGEINLFKNDNLIKEYGMAGFSEMDTNGFSEMESIEEPMMENSPNGADEETLRTFYRMRFQMDPSSDPEYYDTWVRRLKGGEIERYMDSESREIWNSLVNSPETSIDEIDLDYGLSEEEEAIDAMLNDFSDEEAPINTPNFDDEVSDIETKYNINPKYDDYLSENTLKKKVLTKK